MTWDRLFLLCTAGIQTAAFAQGGRLEVLAAEGSDVPAFGSFIYGLSAEYPSISDEGTVLFRLALDRGVGQPLHILFGLARRRHSAYLPLLVDDQLCGPEPAPAFPDPPLRRFALGMPSTYGPILHRSGLPERFYFNAYVSIEPPPPPPEGNVWDSFGWTVWDCSVAPDDRPFPYARRFVESSPGITYNNTWLYNNGDWSLGHIGPTGVIGDIVYWRPLSDGAAIEQRTVSRSFHYPEGGQEWLAGESLLDFRGSLGDDSAFMHVIVADAIGENPPPPATFVLRSRGDTANPPPARVLAEIGEFSPPYPSTVFGWRFSQFQGIQDTGHVGNDPTWLLLAETEHLAPAQTITGVFRFSEGAPVGERWSIVCREGDAFPTGSGSFSIVELRNGYFRGPMGNAIGETVQQALVQWSGSPSSEQIVFVLPVDAPPPPQQRQAVVICRVGGPTGEPAGYHWSGDFSVWATNKRGDVLFSAATQQSGLPAVTYGLFLSRADDRAHPLLILRTGDGIEVSPGVTRTVSDLLESNQWYSNGADGRRMSLNNAGEVTALVRSTDFQHAVIRWMPPCEASSPCDLNFDGNIDQDDITLLISLVSGGEDPFPCVRQFGPDMNEDGNVDQNDIAWLIDAIGGGC